MFRYPADEGTRIIKIIRKSQQERRLRGYGVPLYHFCTTYNRMRELNSCHFRRDRYILAFYGINAMLIIGIVFRVA